MQTDIGMHVNRQIDFLRRIESLKNANHAAHLCLHLDLGTKIFSDLVIIVVRTFG